MTDLCLCTKRAVGFAAVASFSVALTGAALGDGSDLPDGTVSIPSLPFSDTGSTVGAGDEFDAVCPFTGSTSPDEFYAFSPAADVSIVVSLCNSGYDTKVYILDSSFAEIACNDDACGPDGFRSELDCTLLEGGETYHIAVDGFGGDSGTYEIHVEECTPPGPCILECPPGSVDEGEPCGDDTNGGCNSVPPVFFDLDCDTTVCGLGWADAGTRDTDWYQVDTTADGFDTVFTWCATAEYDHVVGVVSDAGGEPTSDCATAAVLDPFAVGAPCEEACVTVGPLAPGIYWFFAAPVVFDLVPCGVGEPLGNDYVATLDCEAAAPPCPWDFDGDNSVGFSDLLKILSNWGPCPGP
jgi:hypothetical protein